MMKSLCLTFNIGFWFQEDVIKCLAKIKAAINEIGDWGECTIFIRLARYVSPRLKGWKFANHKLKICRPTWDIMKEVVGIRASSAKVTFPWIGDELCSFVDSLACYSRI